MKFQNEEDGSDFCFVIFLTKVYNEILISSPEMDQLMLLINMPMY